MLQGEHHFHKMIFSIEIGAGHGYGMFLARICTKRGFSIKVNWRLPRLLGVTGKDICKKHLTKRVFSIKIDSGNDYDKKTFSQNEFL